MGSVHKALLESGVVEEGETLLLNLNFVRSIIQRSGELIMSGSGKTVFVTGGGGYVASHSIIELLKDDFNVVAVDNFVNSIRDQATKSPSKMPESLVRVQRLT